jgi:hypothetical protein
MTSGLALIGARQWSATVREKTTGHLLNVCPSGVANAPVGARQVLDNASSLQPKRLGAGTRRLRSGRIDPECRWIGVVARTPFGVTNREHITLSPVGSEPTLVRFD